MLLVLLRPGWGFCQGAVDASAKSYASGSYSAAWVLDDKPTRKPAR